MASSARIDELKRKFDENPRRYFAPLANEFRKTGELEQAIMICEEFLPQQPGHMSGHIVYGQALFESGRLDQAKSVFETALTLDHENLIALRHLGDIARAQGDLSTARRWYDRVLDADPRNEEIQQLIASLANDASASDQSRPIDETPEVDLAVEQSQNAAPTPSGDALDVMALELDIEESMEFAPPGASAAPQNDLGDALEHAEFTAPSASVAPLADLEDDAMSAFETRGSSAPLPTSVPEEQPASVARAMDGLPELSTELPTELPPEVIAAEAELIEQPAMVSAEPSTSSGMSQPRMPDYAPDSPSLTPQTPFVTETMAELYVKQGFREQALDVYKLLLAASPDSERLKQRVAELQTPAAATDTGPTVRELFARLAARRPGERAAAAAPPTYDDFASFEPTIPGDSHAPEAPEAFTSSSRDTAPSPTPSSEPHTRHLEASGSAPTETHRDARDSSGHGSIDTLFGSRGVEQADDSAASSLAQAFGGTTENAPMSGRPARAASAELSLDSVFRGGPPRPRSGNFSFDQFFSENATSDATAGSGGSPMSTPSQSMGAPSEPAEESSDDIEQFNAWLQGLKRR